MVVFRYKSFSILSIVFLLLVFTQYGCGGRSESLVDESSVGPPDGISSAGSGPNLLSTVIGGTEGTSGNPTCVNTDTDPNRNKVQAGNVCDRLSTIQCAGEACCCEHPNRDFNACKQGMMEYCREHLRLDVISSDASTGFDPVFAEQVFSQYEQMASRCDVNVVFWGTSFDGLRGIIKGTIEPGRPCTPRSEWGETLDEAGAAALASCKDPVNTACSHPAILLWTCSPRVGVGGNCITDLNCLDGLYCDNPNLLLLGAVCKQRKNLGSACTLPNECQSLICRGGKCVEVNQQNVYCLSV